MTPPTIEQVRADVSAYSFGSPLIQNNLRALVVETIVHFALKPTWTRTGENWAGWDFEHKDSKTRLEVKQSARKQSWTSPEYQSQPRFDIAPRTGYWEGAKWIDRKERHAQIYVFAMHAIVDSTADQRDPSQWRFYVIPTTKLPETRSIGMSGIKQLSGEIGFDGLFEAVETARKLLN